MKSEVIRNRGQDLHNRLEYGEMGIVQKYYKNRIMELSLS